MPIELAKSTEFLEQCGTRIIGPHNAPIEINVAGTLGSYLNTSKATSGNIIILSVAPSFPSLHNPSLSFFENFIMNNF